MTNKSTKNFKAGLHSKAEHVSIYLAEKHQDNCSFINPNKEHKITKARYIVTGYNWNFAKDFAFTTDIYYQHLYDVLVKEGDTTGIMS